MSLFILSSTRLLLNPRQSVRYAVLLFLPRVAVVVVDDDADDDGDEENEDAETDDGGGGCEHGRQRTHYTDEETFSECRLFRQTTSYNEPRDRNPVESL